MKAAWQLNSATISTSRPEESVIRKRTRKKKEEESLKGIFYSGLGMLSFYYSNLGHAGERKWKEGCRGKRKVG